MSKKPSKTEILTYSVPLLTPFNQEILNTLSLAKRAGNYFLRKLFHKEILESLFTRVLPAYKILEPIIENKDFYLPSRINRGILEITGRILRQQGDRLCLFSALLACEKDPQKWDFNLLKELKNLYEKSQYIENLAEQTENYLEKSGNLPADYFALTKAPQLKRGMISYAPDDGQALKLKIEASKLLVEMKVVHSENPQTRQEWKWISFELPLPSILEGKELLSPDLRCGIVHGKWVPLLDIKVKVACKQKKETGNFLVVDWGIRKLITICVFNRSGEQISPPFFLKWSSVLSKLISIRHEIDCLKSKRDKLPLRSTLWGWYNKEVALRWNKFRQIQKQLSHLASNCIIEIANIYECSSIYVEWLKSLKSDSFGKETNWKINSTVRQAIYEKVQYKARLNGISFERPLPAGYSSQFCPKCGGRGHHVLAPDRLKEEQKSGSWFYCPNCGYNADRDYVACHSLARRALFGNKLKGQSKTFAYTTKVTSDILFRQSIEKFSKLRHCLNGWKNVVFLKPVIERAGTLRL